MFSADAGLLGYVTIAPTVPGDYNQNGVADAADYVVWRNTLGNNVAPFSGADGNGSGTIDAGDYGVWKANFGHTAGSGSGATANAAVPEPATLVLLILAAIGTRLRVRHIT